MNFIARFFHEIRNPHCPECEEELMRDPVVDELKSELAAVRYERDRLLKHLLEPQSASVDVVLPTNAKDEESEPFIRGSKRTPWPVRRAMLEQEDRIKATKLEEFRKDQEKAISELEKSLKLDIPEGNEDVQSESVKVNG